MKQSGMPVGIVAMVMACISQPSMAANFDQQQICRATIGAVMGRDPKIIKVSKVETGIVHLHYSRPDDGSIWEHRCRLEGQKVIWATKTGRWREHPMDEVITYAVSKTSVTIKQKFVDGSTSTKSYTPAQIGS